MTFSYTSGTTGNPKAALLSHNNFASALAAFESHQTIEITEKDVHLSYLPLPHVMERLNILALMFRGASIQ